MTKFNKNAVVAIHPTTYDVGWAYVENKNEVNNEIEKNKGKAPSFFEFGVRTFIPAGKSKDRRTKRSARRSIRRKKWRRNQMINAFDEFGIISRNELTSEKYLDFSTYVMNHGGFRNYGVYSLAHLRCKALHEQVSKQEMAMCIFNILKHRGNFYMDQVDFENGEKIKLEDLATKIDDLVDQCKIKIVKNEQYYNTILKYIREKTPAKKMKDDLNLDALQYESKENKEKFKQLLLAINGNAYKALLLNPESLIINEDGENCPEISQKGTVDVNKHLKTAVQLDKINEQIMNLYSFRQIYKILNDHDYVCEGYAEELEKIPDIHRYLDTKRPDGPVDERMDEIVKEYILVSGKTYDDKKFGKKHNISAFRNQSNDFPNGLFVKEAKAILYTQQKYYPEITEEFIEVAITVLKAIIPYYIGPLDEKATNAWLVKNGTFKYSYDFSKGNVDELTTVSNWKKNMISHCTYLPDEYAMPKGSFVGETFAILNELNILTAVDADGVEIGLSADQKIKVMNELFLNPEKNEILYEDVRECLGLSYFGPQSRTGKSKSFKQKYSLYKKIVKTVPTLRIHSIVDILHESEKIDTIEAIALDINLYDTKTLKTKALIKEGLDEKDASSIAATNMKGFYNLSNKFVLHTPMDDKNRSMIEILLMKDNPNPNSEKNQFEKNEQMTIITKAQKMNGQQNDFISNKYLRMFKKQIENGQKPKLDIHLIQDANVHFIASRPVIRSLNETFKVINAICESYAIPGRIVVEIPRELPTFDTADKEKEQKKKSLASLYDYAKKKANKIGVKAGYTIDDKLCDSLCKSENTKTLKKMELYIRQLGYDPLTGKKILINDEKDLNNYEISHITFEAFGGNSMNNLMLVHRDINRPKGQMFPMQFLKSPKSEYLGEDRVKEYSRLVQCMYDCKLISQEKYELAMIQSFKDFENKVNGDLNDTRYIARELIAALNAYFKITGHDKVRVVALKPAIAAEYGNAMRFFSPMNKGDQESAYKAMINATTDMILSHCFPHYDEGRISRAYINHYMNIAEKNTDRNYTKSYIQTLYNSTFGENPTDKDSFIEKVKATMPLYSSKVIKKYTGEFWKANMISQKSNGGSDVLNLFNINNDKVRYSGVECFCADYYKYTDKKGIKQHAFIQIPKFIVDNNGNINPEAYKKLIKGIYPKDAPYLLDKNGNINMYYFRLRFFEGDLITDTCNKTVRYFKPGAISGPCPKFKDITICPYKELEERKNEIQNCVYSPKGSFFMLHNYNDYIHYEDKEAIFRTIVEDVIKMYPKSESKVERWMKLVVPNKKNQKYLSRFCLDAAFYERFYDRPNASDNPLTMVISKKAQNYITYSENTDKDEFIKIMTSPLGIRFTDEMQDEFYGPKRNAGKFKKVRKEPFRWNIQIGE